LPPIFAALAEPHPVMLARGLVAKCLAAQNFLAGAHGSRTAIPLKAVF